MLDGERKYRSQEFNLAFNSLQKSIALADNLPYNEPWGWMKPPRHTCGALLLEQGYVEQAAELYSVELGTNNSLARALQHPNNVSALRGHHECLVRLGREAEARIVRPQLMLAIAIADVSGRFVLLLQAGHCQNAGLGELLRRRPGPTANGLAWLEINRIYASQCVCYKNVIYLPSSTPTC